MWFNMTKKKLAFSDPPNITPFKIGINCLTNTEFAITWEIVKFHVGMGFFVHVTGLCHL